MPEPGAGRRVGSARPRATRRRGAALVAIVHACLQCVPPALTRHAAPPPAAAGARHVGATSVADCPRGGGLAVAAWAAMGNGSAGARAFGAREYLTGVELVWNTADALFPEYRHAALLYGGRGSDGTVRGDAWLVPMPRDARDASLLTLANATLIEPLGEQAPARWGHSAVWTGRGADKAETWPTPRSYAGRIEENSDLLSAQGHPVQDLRHTVSGKLHAGSTIAPCVGGNTRHKHTGLDCDSRHGRAGGCSCVRLDVQSRTNGVLDSDTVVNESSAPLFPSVWSGRRLEIIAGPGRGYEGFISYNSDNHVYNLAPALDVQLGFAEDTAHFVITEAEAMQTPSVPLDTMWVFGGRDGASNLTNDVYALTTSIAPHLDGITAASAVDYQYSPTGYEDFTRSTNGWFYEKSQLVDFGSPLRPTPGPRGPRIVQSGPAETSVCGEYGSILGGYQLLGPDTVLSKTYITSAAHTSVQISFDFIKIDFWNGEQVQLFVDGSLVWARSFSSNPDAAVREPQICGRDDPPGFRGETLVPVNVTVPHSGPNMSISLRLRYNDTAPSASPANASNVSSSNSLNASNASSSSTSSAGPRSLDSWWGLRRVYVRTLPQGFAWRRVKAKHAGDGVPAPRAHHAAAQFREMMFVFGGSTAQVVPTLNSEVMVFTDHSALNDTKLGDLWAFNTTSETWHALEPSIDEQARDR